MLTVLWRRILATPMMTGVIVLSLAAGIGANASVFSWIQARLFRPLPGVAGSASLLLVEPVNDSGLFVGSSWLEYQDLRARMRQLPDLIAARMSPLYVGEPGATERLYGLLVSDNYFSALGVRLAAGRGFVSADFAEDRGEAVAVISYGLWQSKWGGSPTVIGQSIRVNGRPCTVVGVTTVEFQGTVLGLNFDVWLPATLAPSVTAGSQELTSRSARGYAVIGFADRGVGVAQAQQELDAVMAGLADEHPATNASIRAQVLPFWQGPRGPQRLIVVALVVLQALMALLLLAVCGNTASLFLARASARSREIGVRLALGAAPRHVVGAVMGETVAMGLAGAVGGAALAVWGTQALVVLPLTGLPVRFQTELDWGGVAFAAALGLVAGCLVGAVPAWQLSRLDAQAAIRAGSRFSARSPVRSVLMGVQAALAVMVLIVAGLFLRSFQSTRGTDPGFVREGVQLAAFDLSGRPAPPGGMRTFVGRLLEGVRALPEVGAAAVAAAVPLDVHGWPNRVFTLDGRERADGEFDRALANIVTPGYFGVMQIPLMAGSDFVSLDDRDAPAQVVVNQAFVDRYLDGAAEAAIGRRLDARGTSHVIVGVVRTSLYDAFGEPPTPALYFSYRDGAVASGELHVRSRSGAESAVIAGLRRVVREIDPDLPLFNLRTLTDHVETNLVFRRVPARVFALLSPILILLVGLGIYSLVSYSVSLRTSELGVRLALGATPRRVEVEVLTDSLRVVVAGVLVGWLVAFVGVRALVPEQADAPEVFLGVPMLLVVVAIAASWTPARRGARVDPVVALRSE